MVIGKGIDSLFMSTFKNADAFAVVTPETSVESGLLVPLLAGASAFAIPAVIGGLLPLLTLVSLLSLAILFTLIIRQGLLIFLTIISPIAIACFVLPGTEKYFQKWLDLFLKTLMVYPIIMVILAMSKVLASILIGTSSLSPDAIGGVKVFAAILVIYAPLALIPFAFKLAGGALGAIAGVAIGRAQKTGGAMGDKMRGDPDSLSSRLRRKIDSKYVDKGLTGGQLWAGATGGLTRGRYGSRSKARAARRGAAREFDQFRGVQAESQAGRFKMNAQDSDVQDAMLMDSYESTEYLERLKKDLANKKISQNVYDRKMRAHALADSMGRNSANQRAAFLSGDRIKFSENSHQQEIDLANKIFRNDSAAVASAMNAHQAIATSVGRADLAQSLYADRGDPTRGSSKAGAGGIMAGHSSGVKNSVEDLMLVAKNLDKDGKAAKYTNAQRTQAAQTLATMRGLAKSPYGQGNEENKRVVRENDSAIDAALGTFVSDTSVQDPDAKGGTSYLHSELKVQQPGQEQLVSDGKGGFIKQISPPSEQVLSGAAAARRRLDELAGLQIDPSIAAQQGQKPPGQQGQDQKQE